MQLQSLQSLQCYQCLKKILVTFKFVGLIHCRCDVQSVIHAFTVSRLHQVVNSTVAVFPYSVYCCTNFADDAQRLAVDFYPCSYYTEFFASRSERCICVTIHHMEYIVVNKRNIIIAKVFFDGCRIVCRCTAFSFCLSLFAINIYKTHTVVDDLIAAVHEKPANFSNRRNATMLRSWKNRDIPEKIALVVKKNMRNYHVCANKYSNELFPSYSRRLETCKFSTWSTYRYCIRY